MNKNMDIKPMTHCFIPGCTAIAEWNKLLFFKMSFGDLPHWWKSTAWVAKHNTELPRDALICERHFEERFIDRSRKKPRLMVGTIPTLNLTTLEVDNQENIEFFCRMCAKREFAPMRYRLDQLNGMHEVIDCCLGRYRAEEGLPSGICESCVQKVKLFAEFVKQCEESQLQILKLKNKKDQSTESKSGQSVDAMKKNACTEKSTDIAGGNPLQTENLSHIGNNGDQALKTCGTRPISQKKSSKTNLSCPDCDKIFKTKGRYYAHLQNHNKHSFGCQICWKKFQSSDELRKHLERIHCGKVDNKCAPCGKIFLTRSQLNHHREEEHRSMLANRPNTGDLNQERKASKQPVLDSQQNNEEN